MDLKGLRTKLVGSKQERAVSPVIGVILMVAITVILAAVIATFVMDMGSGLDDEPRATVDIEGDGTPEVDVQVTNIDNADGVAIVDDGGSIVDTLESTGASASYSSSSEGSGNYTAQAYNGGSSVSSGNNIEDNADNNAIVGNFELT